MKLAGLTTCLLLSVACLTGCHSFIHASESDVDKFVPDSVKNWTSMADATHSAVLSNVTMETKKTSAKTFEARIQLTFLNNGSKPGDGYAELQLSPGSVVSMPVRGNSDGFAKVYPADAGIGVANHAVGISQQFSFVGMTKASTFAVCSKNIYPGREATVNLMVAGPLAGGADFQCMFLPKLLSRADDGRVVVLAETDSPVGVFDEEGHQHSTDLTAIQLKSGWQLLKMDESNLGSDNELIFADNKEAYDKISAMALNAQLPKRKAAVERVSIKQLLLELKERDHDPNQAYGRLIWKLKNCATTQSATRLGMEWNLVSPVTCALIGEDLPYPWSFLNR
jgi:hypothetical protein